MSDEGITTEQCDRADCIVSPERRRFLRDSVLSVAGALIAVGMSKSAAFAMPLELTQAMRSVRSMHTYPIPAADGAQIDKDNQVILVRWQDAVYAFSLSCPHQNTALRWDDGEHTFLCPKHHSKFTATGDYIAGSGRATRNMDRLPIHRDGAGVSVDVDTVYQEDADGPEWAAAVVRLK
jgi:nitrite reductase/ring-hydroxylating ferredoxin subunit